METLESLISAVCFRADGAQAPTFPQQSLHHLAVPPLGRQGQRCEAVVAPGVRVCTGLQQQGHHGDSAQPRSLVERPASVAELQVDLGAPQEQQLHQVFAV